MENDMVICLCGSRKPAASQNRNSASRQLLKIAEASIRRTGVTTKTFDLKLMELPFFEGLHATEYPQSSDLMNLYTAISESRALLISAPAYWGGVGGPLKNCLDLLGGAAYDNPIETTVFSNKLVGLLVIGAQDDDAELAEQQLRTTLSKLQGSCLPKAIIVNNPHQADHEKLVRLVWDYGLYMAQSINSYKGKDKGKNEETTTTRL